MSNSKQTKITEIPTMTRFDIAVEQVAHPVLGRIVLFKESADHRKSAKNKGLKAWKRTAEIHDLKHAPVLVLKEHGLGGSVELKLGEISRNGAWRRARAFVKHGKVPFGVREQWQQLRCDANDKKRAKADKKASPVAVGTQVGTPVEESKKLEIVIKAVRPGYAVPTLSVRSFRDEPGAEVLNLTPDRDVIDTSKPSKKDGVSIFARAHGDRPIMVASKA